MDPVFLRKDARKRRTVPRHTAGKQANPASALRRFDVVNHPFFGMHADDKRAVRDVVRDLRRRPAVIRAYATVNRKHANLLKRLSGKP
jgi:hypothetical protein